MTALQRLALDRVDELAQLVLTTHEDMERWREKPFEAIERTKMSIKLQSYIAQQASWLKAVLDEEDES